MHTTPLGRTHCNEVEKGRRAVELEYAVNALGVDLANVLGDGTVIDVDLICPALEQQVALLGVARSHRNPEAQDLGDCHCRHANGRRTAADEQGLTLYDFQTDNQGPVASLKHLGQGTENIPVELRVDGKDNRLGYHRVLWLKLSKARKSVL